MEEIRHSDCCRRWNASVCELADFDAPRVPPRASASTRRTDAPSVCAAASSTAALRVAALCRAPRRRHSFPEAERKGAP
eukprot:6889880-Alexandrium_andersonii.AAC.1